VNLSRDYISRIFKNETGRSIQSFLSGVRLNHAMRLLDSGMSVERVSAACGFNSATHFSRQFKAHIGLSPQAWLKKIRTEEKDNFTVFLPTDL